MKQKIEFILPEQPLSATERVAVVTARFNPEICDGLLNGALTALKKYGATDAQIDIFRVPGAFEIPIVAQRAARSGKYAGLVALGCVIRGDTPHFDYVCNAVTDGTLRVSLDSNLPVAFGIITTNTLAQAQERASDDDFNKGTEAVLTLLKTLDVIRKI